MPKYENTHVQQLEQELSAPQQQATPQVQAAPPSTPDDESFKKRYGDLRRHMANMQDQKDKEIEDLREQLDSATKGQIKFPKTDAEIDQWSKKYPQVAEIVDSIAQKRANEVLQRGEKRLEKMERLEAKLTKQSAEKELKKMHPDFDTIRESRVFHDWVKMQPQWVQDALYQNTTDAHAASRAIDLYKIDKGMRKRPASSGGAAASVPRTAQSTPAGMAQGRFTESQVEKMSSQEYEKNEAAILEAMQKGMFLYDISGAAR